MLDNVCLIRNTRVKLQIVNKIHSFQDRDKEGLTHMTLQYILLLEITLKIHTIHHLPKN